MKLLQTFKNEYLLEDGEDTIIERFMNDNGGKGFIKLKCGAFINASSIDSIGDVPLIPYSQGGYPLNSDGRSFMKDGQKVFIQDLNTIQYLPDPKYKQKFPQLESKK